VTERPGPGVILRLIAPAAPGTAISAAVRAASRGWYRLTVRIGGRRLSFLSGVGGGIRAA
jgi:hypothetical protein